MVVYVLLKLYYSYSLRVDFCINNGVEKLIPRFIHLEIIHQLEICHLLHLHTKSSPVQFPAQKTIQNTLVTYSFIKYLPALITL